MSTKITTSITDSKLKVRYRNENEFNKRMRSLRMYNMRAYKDLVFYYVPAIRQGELMGEKIGENHYKCVLSSDKIFKYVYGDVYFEYTIDPENNDVILEKIEPDEFLVQGHQRVLDVYKGVAVLGAKEKFKVDMYNTLNTK